MKLSGSRAFFNGKMTEQQINYVKWCIRNDIHKFYTWRAWRRVRAKALRLDHMECRRCREKKKTYVKATTVHHVNHVKERPDLALEVWYVFRGVKKRNLVSLCDQCHLEVHGYRIPEEKTAGLDERWD